MENTTTIYIKSVIATEVIYEYEITDLEKFKELIEEHEITEISELWDKELLNWKTPISKFVGKEYEDARGEDYYESCWSDDDELNDIVSEFSGDI